MADDARARATRRREIAQMAALVRWGKPTKRVTPEIDQQIARLNAESAAATYRYWKERVDLARMIMGAAITDYDECRERLREAERECHKLAGLLR